MTSLDLYDTAAHRSAARVISTYSTSFGLASRLLGAQVRRHVVDIYALVRIADEIVDGPAQQAGLDVAARREALDALERDVEHALEGGFSTNLVVHAFATTARRTGFGATLTRPFFASMRRDLEPVTDLRQSEFEAYVDGSAEVVGLMCLHAFTAGERAPHQLRARLAPGARHLGAAFQKINFLRDLGEDYAERGRSYFPGIDPARLTETDKARLLDDIETDLRIAAEAIPHLPRASRRAVAAAHALFTELARVVRATPAHRLVKTRVRVPDTRKVVILAGSALGTKVRA